MWEKTSLPAKDELEVSIIGPGFGEAILVHLGNGAWASIDSCVDSEGECVSLAYLKALGANPDQLRFVIATHWHEDHIRGMPQLINWSSNPQFWCPTVFAADDFLDFASANAEDDISPLGAASSELGKIFDVLLDRKITPNLAHQDTVILSQHALQIFALSPLQARVIQFLKVIAGLIPTLKQPRRRVADLHPNLVSLVLRFVVGSNCIVLGADLQETPFNGWTDLLNNSQCIEGPRASLFKVPHHGSHNAHLDRQWTDLLIANPHVALTPYNRGSRKLPHATDVARILKLSNNSFSTARATSTAPNRFDTAVVRSLKEGNIVMHSSDTKLGHVQFRKLINDPTKPWRTTLFGNAVRLHNIGV